jgi:hypothetical protein
MSWDGGMCGVLSSVFSERLYVYPRFLALSQQHRVKVMLLQMQVQSGLMRCLQRLFTIL